MKKITFAALLILITMLLIIQTSTPVIAEDSGLLITLRHDTKNNNKGDNRWLKPALTHHYRTLWIYPQGNKLKVLEGKKILVPRDDGFWKVGTKKVVEDKWTEDVLYSVPVGKSIGKLKLPDDMENTSGYKDVGILFIGNNHISIEMVGDGYTKGAAHPFHFNRLYVYSLDKLGKAVKLSKIMGIQADKVLMEDSKRYLKNHPEKKDALYHQGSPDTWGLIRMNGAWALRGFIDYSCEAARGNFAHYDISLRPTAKLVSHDKLIPSWSIIKKNIPNALDAFSSPDYGILGVMTPRELRLYTTKDRVNFSQPDRRIQLKKNEFAVMIQWSMGSYIKKWTQVMKKHLQ